MRSATVRPDSKPPAEEARVWLSPIEIDPGSEPMVRDLTDPEHRQYLFVHSGGGVAELDGWITEFGPGNILFIPSRTVSHVTLQPGSRAFFFGIADSLLISRVSAALGVPLAEFMHHFHRPRKLDYWGGKAEASNRDRLWNELTLASGRLGPTGDTVVAAYVLLLLFEKSKYDGPLSEADLGDVAPRTVTEPESQSAAADLVLAFRKLIEDHFGDQWRIQEYCTALGARVSELASACREVLGCTPSTLIHERVLLDARRRLTYSKASASEIAYDLGFSDSAYFSRFFKRQTGLSPIEFRRTYTSQRSHS